MVYDFYIFIDSTFLLQDETGTKKSLTQLS